MLQTQNFKQEKHFFVSFLNTLVIPSHVYTSIHSTYFKKNNIFSNLFLYKYNFSRARAKKIPSKSTPVDLYDEIILLQMARIGLFELYVTLATFTKVSSLRKCLCICTLEAAVNMLHDTV